MATIAPVHHKQRAAAAVLVFLRCGCGYRERWPIPPTANIGRCTCPNCGGQLHEDPEAPPLEQREAPVSLVKFHARNHRQQVGRRGADPKIDDRATLPEVFDPLHARFTFTVDAAAAEHNAKLSRYFDRETVGLAQPWTRERVWCNPPYSEIRPWIEKAWSEIAGDGYVDHGGADLVVMLLPANRTEQAWWQDLVEPYRDRAGSFLRVEFLRGRLRFIAAGKTEVGPNERPPFGCCLLIWERS